MTQSMTGFGKAAAAVANGNLTVEMQSVNRKFLELSLSLPPGFSHLEMDIRKEISTHLTRGFVTVRIHFSNLDENDSLGIVPSFESLLKLKTSWETLAVRLGYKKECIDLPFLLNKISLEEKKEDFSFEQIRKPVLNALKELIESRKKEGIAILKEILKRLDGIETVLYKISEKVPISIEANRIKLRARFIDLFPKDSELEERVLREAAILAEKCDITEELDRLKSHLHQFRKEHLQDGKKMDFLVQEMGREIHTIGSKANDLEITRFVLDLKGELEKIREQVQNIE